VDRHGQKLDVKMDIPAPDPTNAEAPIKLGIAQGKLTLVHPRPWDQVEDSVQTIVNMVGALTSSGGDVQAAHFSGPVGIMNLYRRLFELPDGWRLAIWFSVFFNVNLALLNMLPLPVLDGGHITLAIIESIRRKPVTGKWIEVVNTCSALLLIGFMLYVTFFDVGDLFRKDKPEPKSEKPVPAEQSE
jgi:regulator of sigma E protease